MPVAMLGKYPVAEITVDMYGEALVEHLRTVHHKIKALMQDAADEHEQNAPGALHRELHVGDLVLRRLGKAAHQRQAWTRPLRMTRQTDPTIYRISKVVANQGFAYRLVDHADPGRTLTFPQPVSRRMLVKLDMPELEIDTMGERRIEVRNQDEEAWEAGTVEAVALDGRALVRFDERPAAREDVVLADRRFRWIVGGAVREWAD